MVVCLAHNTENLYNVVDSVLKPCIMLAWQQSSMLLGAHKPILLQTAPLCSVLSLAHTVGPNSMSTQKQDLTIEFLQYIDYVQNIKQKN